MNKFLVNSIADRIRIGYLAAFLLLLLSYILTFSSAQKLITQANLVTHTNEVIYNLDYIMASVNRSESDFRGYILTGNTALLKGYERNKHLADSALENVKQLTYDNSRQQEDLDEIAALMAEGFAKMDNSFSINPGTSGSNNDSLRTYIASVMVTMENLEKAVRVSQNEEKSLLGERAISLSRYTNTIKVINIISIILAISLTIYSIITFNKENRGRLIANRKAAGYQAQLQQRFDELAKVNIELIELRNIEKFSLTGRISRTIAHEVRNPLTNINLAVEHLKSFTENSEEAAMLLDMIVRNTKRINELISNLLNSTRSAEMKLEQENINKLLDTSLEFAQDRIELKKIKVVKNYEKDLCSVLVDKEKIYIAFLNIIVNAIEAMDKNGTLYLTTEDYNNKCVVKITDTGKGMPKGDISKLFEPFFTTKDNGNGLGLTNTQNIILGHKASISADSELGKGTTFTVSFNYAPLDNS